MTGLLATVTYCGNLETVVQGPVRSIALTMAEAPCACVDMYADGRTRVYVRYPDGTEIDAEAPERYSEPQKAEQPPGDNPGAAPDEAS